MSLIKLHEEINGQAVQVFDQVSPHNIPDTGYCQFPLCKRISNHDGYCFHHKMHSSKPVVKKVQVGIAKVSDKRKKEQKEYVKIVKEMLEKNPLCEIKSPVCTGFADGLDHIAKRSPNNFLDRNNLQNSCSQCNLYKELNPIWATENGFSISRFKK